MPPQYVFINGERHELLDDRRCGMYPRFPEGTELYDPSTTPPTLVPLSHDQEDFGVSLRKLVPWANYFARTPEGTPVNVPPRFLVVHNVPAVLTARDLGQYFEHYSQVTEADILRWPGGGSGNSKCRGYVALQSPEAMHMLMKEKTIYYEPFDTYFFLEPTDRHPVTNHAPFPHTHTTTNHPTHQHAAGTAFHQTATGNALLPPPQYDHPTGAAGGMSSGGVGGGAPSFQQGQHQHGQHQQQQQPHHTQTRVHHSGGQPTGTHHQGGGGGGPSAHQHQQQHGPSSAGSSNVPHRHPRGEHGGNAGGSSSHGAGDGGSGTGGGGATAAGGGAPRQQQQQHGHGPHYEHRRGPTGNSELISMYYFVDRMREEDVSLSIANGVCWPSSANRKEYVSAAQRGSVYICFLVSSTSRNDPYLFGYAKLVWPQTDRGSDLGIQWQCHGVQLEKRVLQERLGVNIVAMSEGTPVKPELGQSIADCIDAAPQLARVPAKHSGGPPPRSESPTPAPLGVGLGASEGDNGHPSGGGGNKEPQQRKAPRGKKSGNTNAGNSSNGQSAAANAVVFDAGDFPSLPLS